MIATPQQRTNEPNNTTDITLENTPTNPSQQPATPPPAMQLMQLITGMWVTKSLEVVATLGVPDRLQAGPQSIDDLAQAVGAYPPYLYRLLRSLASVGLFSEITPQTFALTEMGTYLCSNTPGSLRALAMTVCDEWQWNCWGDLLNVVKTGQPAMQRLYQVEDTFEYLTQHPTSGQIFAEAMTGWSRTIHAAIVEAYDFSNLKTLVDIAGGRGALLTDILVANPHLRGILFDLPSIVSGEILDRSGLSDRADIVGGSFFESVPTGGDAYILSHILHDWNDEDCLRILKTLRKSMAPHSKLLIVEMVIPPGDTPHFGKLLDIDMMALFFGGRERTETEYQDLFQAAGFKLDRMIPTSAPVSILEGICD